MTRLLSRLLPLLAIPLLAGCVSRPLLKEKEASPATCACTCPACPGVEPTKPPEKPPEKPLQPAAWSDLPGWGTDDLRPAFAAFLTSCRSLGRQALWAPVCTSARSLQAAAANDATEALDGERLRAWFEEQLQPWQLVNPEGTRDGLITGYYEPLLKGSRKRSKQYAVPVFGPPDDLITVDLGDLYPELKHMRLRGRLEGRRLVPYFSRAEWSRQEPRRLSEVLLWVDDAIDFFFMQIQGSGQIALDDGNRIRLGYGDQNGHPYRSIGKWLIDQGELSADQASMQGIRAWAQAHPQRLQELLNANPSVVFFKEMKAEGSGPPGAMGLALTPERSLAVDPKNVPLGAPLWLATTQPLSDEPLERLMMAQDTGGAIRGVVRADFYWGSGPEAGARAGKMRQRGRLWVLMPPGYAPK